ncbi:hypothetical protein N5853_09230 [Bartonella sp. HY329]|uniref:hypothetical protein n=1 Tax=unclassified Bartonella TaxID=2645622 RepID=UPI0021C935D7|nr:MULTISPECIES: hypothetical protein [unclassified Bartonella]UXM94288.1 hypothetical protein N5853_09230 [Bartonella sp. HY329]UXN08611.1 hypothetical protein N5852_09240 [Bartonella sp. HY328]
MQRAGVCSGVLLSFNKVFTMTQDEARQKAIKAGVESLKAGFANVFDHDEWLKALNLALDIFTEQCGFIKEAPKQGQGAIVWQPISEFDFNRDYVKPFLVCGKLGQFNFQIARWENWEGYWVVGDDHLGCEAYPYFAVIPEIKGYK